MVCLSSKDEFQCKLNECIKWAYVCDGISHCSNGADEDCGKYLFYIYLRSKYKIVACVYYLALLIRLNVKT